MISIIRSHWNHHPYLFHSFKSISNIYYELNECRLFFDELIIAKLLSFVNTFFEKLFNKLFSEDSHSFMQFIV